MEVYKTGTVTGGEHPAHEEVIVRVDFHLILVVPKMLDRVGRSGVEVEAQHHELPQETVSHDFLREWRAENIQAT